MNIIFFGSDSFAAAHLQSLIKTDHNVVACVTQPDRPKGRGLKVIVSEIKDCAQKYDIPIVQPQSLKEDGVIEELKSYNSDVFVVIAYGRFLPDAMLDSAQHGAVNVHASLLPKYRGAAPINWAIINGDKVTGISIIKINSDMDAGDILAKEKIHIDPDETVISLRSKMMQVGPKLLERTLDSLAKGQVTHIKQKHDQSSRAPKLTKELGLIQWTKKAFEIDHLVRGLLPWPSAYTFYNGKFLKILQAKSIEGDFSQSTPGAVTQVNKKGVEVATGHGGLLVKKVHFQDSKPMDAHSFVLGHKVEVGFQFREK